MNQYDSVSSSHGYDHCCPPVFDPYTLVALIGGSALATYFLRLIVIITEIMMMVDPPPQLQNTFGFGSRIVLPSLITEVAQNLLVVLFSSS